MRLWYEAAASGRGGVVALVGEAGIGKTWIARQFARHASSRGATVLWGCCFEGDWQPAYGPWVEAVGECVRDGGRETLLNELGSARQLLARLVPAIMPSVSDEIALAPLRTEEERVRLCEALVRFIAGLAADTPAVLVLDDLHWADSDSLRVLRYLAHSLSRLRLLVVCLYRDHETGHGPEHPLPELLAVLRHETDFQRLNVRGLSSAESSLYLEKMAGEACHPGIARAIYAEANGNPFFTRELYCHLIEREEASTALSSPGNFGVPAGVRELVWRRLAHLSAPTRSMLRLASGFSSGFTFAGLQAVVGLSEEATLDCLDEAMAAGLVCVSDAAQPLYDFTHTIVRHAIYGDLNPERRARLHRRIAGALESLYAGQAREHAFELAGQYHASRGLPGASAGMPHALAAAEQAAAIYAPERSVEFLRMACDLAAECSLSARAEVLSRLAIGQAEAQLLEESTDTVAKTLAAMEEAGLDDGAIAAFIAKAARKLKDGGAPSAAWLPLVRRGLAMIGSQRDLTWARLTLMEEQYEPLASGAINVGRWLGLNQEAVAIARARGDEDDYAHSIDPSAWQDRAEADAVLALARAWRRPEITMHAVNAFGRDLLYRQLSLREAAVCYEDLLASGRRYGSLAAQAEALMQIAIIDAAEGALPEAKRKAESALELLSRLGSAHGLHFVALSLRTLMAYYVEGNWAALAAASSACTANPDTGHSLIGLIAAATAAFAHARAGTVREARRYLEALTPVISRVHPTTFGYAVAVSTAAGAVWALESAEYAREYYRLANEVLESSIADSLIGPRELPMAWMATLMKDRTGACDYFTRARRQTEARGCQHLRAIVDCDEALALVRLDGRDGQRIRALLEDALDTFTMLGMRDWESRALALRGRLAPVHPTGPGKAARHSTGLTPREIEVLRLVAAGSTNKEIAARLVLSVPTVERHIANIYGKIDARGRADATAFALRQGLG